MYFEVFKTQYCNKRAAAPAKKILRKSAKIKKGRGETSPRTQTPFAAARIAAQRLGGQKLAALCTAAGENLTAVGSSHSLAETVNHGAVTAAGLVGTLHVVQLLKINNAR